MAKEIERKFLVKGDSWRGLASGKRYRQGYLSTIKERTVRVRTVGEKGFITVKGINTGAARSEYEYEIPLSDATEMLDQLCKRPLIEKTRYRIPFGGHVWEVDEFEGKNIGLITAEVELKEENQAVSIPDWIGPEVTRGPRSTTPISSRTHSPNGKSRDRSTSAEDAKRVNAHFLPPPPMGRFQHPAPSIRARRPARTQRHGQRSSWRKTVIRANGEVS